MHLPATEGSRQQSITIIRTKGTMSEEVREGFIRQRRNLMVMSGVVFFAQYVGLEFKEISFLGNQATITDSSHVMVFLWGLLFYWL